MNCGTHCSLIFSGSSHDRKRIKKAAVAVTGCIQDTYPIMPTWMASQARIIIPQKNEMLRANHFFFQIYLTIKDLQMTKFIIHDDAGHSITSLNSSILDMLWIILLLIILVLAWILLSPLELKIDTRVPVIMVQWKNIGNATLFYEDEEWWLNIRVLFFSKKWNVVQMIVADRKKKKKRYQSPAKKNGRKSMSVFKFFKILKTFQIVQWKIALSADDNTKNARWYWLNFFPLTRRHVHVNFFDENYLVLIIRNKAWRMAYAFIK